MGNGHPFSWSAIINGFNSDLLDQIPFPVIQKYLPSAPFIGDYIDARVTCVWDEDQGLAETVASVAKIPVVAESLEQLMNEVDCVIHARDDYWNHLTFVEHYSTYQKPVFLDKPIATTRSDLEAIIFFDPDLHWLFSASALGWDPNLRSFFGSQPRFISATAPKDWQRYSIHLIEPILSILGYSETPFHTQCRRDGPATLLTVHWDDGRQAQIQTTGTSSTPFAFVLDGIECELADPAQAFAACITDFIGFARGERAPSRLGELKQIVSLIERGL